MDMIKEMILVKGIDKTQEIDVIEKDILERKIKITYKRGKTYSYNMENVRIFNLQREILLKDQVAYINGMPEYQPQRILDFGSKIRIYRFDGSYKTIDRTDFSLISSDAKTKNVKEVLLYLKEISSFLSDKEDEEAFLYKEMKRLNFIHSESVLGSYLGNQLISRRNIEDNTLIFPFQFNLSQKDALEKALSHSISVIEGPPGTGKTQTILNILANLIIRKKSVAVVSNNTEAVKNVIEKMEKQGYGFLNALLGRKEYQEAFFASLPEVQVKEWACEESKENLASKIRELNQRLRDLMKQERDMVQLRQKLEAWTLEQQYFEKYYEKQEIEKIEKLPMFCKSSDRLLSFMADTSIAAQYGISDKFLFKIKLLFKYGIFDLSKLWQDEEALLLSIQKKFYQFEIQSIEKRISSLEHRLQHNSFDDLLKQHQELSKRIFRKYLHENYSYSRMERQRFTKANFKLLFQDFIRAYPIILSTTHSLRRSIPENYLLDYVIIDEASQVDLITGVLALSCCKNAIIVGDEKQLEQITQENRIGSKINSIPPRQEYDYFRHSILSSVLCLYNDKLPRTILREHYRCHPKIINFCNQEYYDGNLIPYTDTSMSESPLILYRTTEGNHMREVTKGDKKGIYNQRELDVIVEEVLKNPDLSEIGGTIGVVTPYRKQANKAAEMLSNKIQSDTVHKYQGRERDTMIMSTVLDSSYKATQKMKFVDDARMVNVSVSRAVKQFILVTDHDLFFQKGKHITHLIRYILYNTLDEKLVNSNVVSVFDLLYKRYSEKLIPLKKRMNPNTIWESEEVIRVLLEDILSREAFCGYEYRQQILLRNLLNDMSLLKKEEVSFVNHRASLDFIIFRKQDKSCVLVIEVDGFAFHENNPVQLQRDAMKDRILKRYGIPVLRLPTNSSGIEKKIEEGLKNSDI